MFNHLFASTKMLQESREICSRTMRDLSQECTLPNELCKAKGRMTTLHLQKVPWCGLPGAPISSAKTLQRSLGCIILSLQGHWPVCKMHKQRVPAAVMLRGRGVNAAGCLFPASCGLFPGKGRAEGRHQHTTRLLGRFCFFPAVAVCKLEPELTSSLPPLRPPGRAVGREPPRSGRGFVADGARPLNSAAHREPHTCFQDLLFALESSSEPVHPGLDPDPRWRCPDVGVVAERPGVVWGVLGCHGGGRKQEEAACKGRKHPFFLLLHPFVSFPPSPASKAPIAPGCSL